MTFICLREVKKSFGDLNVLKGINLDIHEGDRIGLVGCNGAGKTTLANILSGAERADSGSLVRCQNNFKIGYLPQFTSYILNKFERFINSDSGEEKLDSFVEITSQMGLDKVQRWELERFQGLSGGERTKLALAEVWISKPDLLILDEPTNHLDLKGVEWLIKELKKFQGTVLTISHDRYFLDETANRIVELDEGILQEYKGNYSFYREEKNRRYKNQLHQYWVEKKRQKKIEEEIERWKDWSAKAHRDAGKKNIGSDGKQMGLREYDRKKAKKMDIQIKSRIKRLEKMKEEGVKRPKEEKKVLFEFDAAEKHGKRILEAKSISKGFKDRTLFGSSSFYIQRGEKIGLYGENGCGKTTLIRTIIGEENIDSGSIWVSPTARIAYLSQDVTDLDERKTILETMGIDRNSCDAHIWTLMANIGFTGEMLNKPTGCLSLGERTRIKLARMILEGNDFIILDEPTNHLDLASREQLERTLEDYGGTLLIVSHDRYMLEKLCKKMLVFEQHCIQRVECGFKEYLEIKSTRKGVDMSLETERMLIENRIVSILGKISTVSPEHPEYQVLDREFKELLHKKTKIYESRP